MERFWTKVDKSGGCWLWTASKDRKGYGKFCLSTDNMQLAHRVAWAFVNGPIPDGLLVLHRCDVRNCVNPAHLFLGTNQDNVDDMDAKGRRNPPRGERNAWHTLTEEIVRAIRVSTETNAQLGAKYGIHPIYVSQVRNRRSWKHVA